MLERVEEPIAGKTDEGWIEIGMMEEWNREYRAKSISIFCSFRSINVKLSAAG